MRLMALLPLIFATGAAAADANRDIEKAADAFYSIYLKVQPSGVPRGKEQQKFRPYITDSLSKLLKQADQAEQRYYTATKGESPPLVEGDLFTSLFEGAAAFKVLSCDRRTAAGSCWVELTYVDPGDKSSFKWKDKVDLIKEPRGWRVDNIEFLGDWEFMHKGRLKDLLTQVINESKPQ
jgi:hypothetical protein